MILVKLCAIAIDVIVVVDALISVIFTLAAFAMILTITIKIISC